MLKGRINREVIIGWLELLQNDSRVQLHDYSVQSRSNRGCQPAFLTSLPEQNIALVASAKLARGTLKPASKRTQKGAGFGITQQEADLTDTQFILAKILPG